MGKKSVIISLSKISMYHLLKNVTEKWRKLIISILKSDPILKSFLQDYVIGNIQDNIYPHKNTLFKPFEKETSKYSLIVISNRKDYKFYPHYLRNSRILNLYSHFTYSMSSEENKYHRLIWEHFLYRILKYLEKDYSTVFLVLGKENLKPFYTIPKEYIFFDEVKISEIDFDIQYKPIVICTEKFTESTKVLINHLLKLKKQPLINFNFNDKL